MPDNCLSDKVLTKLLTGALPREEPVKVRVGYGRDEPCMACGAPILPSQTMYELQMPDETRVPMHLGCHGLWLAERIRYGWVPRAPATTRAGKRLSAKLETGEIPKTLPTSLAKARGDGSRCTGCDKAISRTQVGYVLDFGGGRVVLFHEDCEQLWRRATGN